MKKTKSKIGLLSLIGLTLMLSVIIAMGIISSSATDETSGSILDDVDIPPVAYPHQDTSSFDVDMNALYSCFSETLELDYADGIVRIEDMEYAEVYYNSPNGFFPLELVDGYWTAEIGERRNDYSNGDYEIVNITSSKNKNGIYWRINYIDGKLDPYINFVKNEPYIEMIINAKSDSLRFLYMIDEYNVDDTYSKGVLQTHSVSNNNVEPSKTVYYNPDKTAKYATVYLNGYYYYFPGQGWSSNWSIFTPCDAPAGYEDADEIYFTSDCPSFFPCEHPEWSEASCTLPKTCMKCGETEGESLGGHVWGELGSENRSICTVCNEKIIPDFDFIVGAYNDLNEVGFQSQKIRDALPAEIEVKYENGKYMVKDFGGVTATGFTDIDYIRTDLTLVDGYWIYEVSEEIYNSDDISIYVELFGEDDIWEIEYCDGIFYGAIQLVDRTPNNYKCILIYLDYDLIETIYVVGEREYRDEYVNGIFNGQQAFSEVDGYGVYVEYDSTGNIEYVSVYGDDHNFYYYYPEYGWKNTPVSYDDPQYSCDAPKGFENADVNFFMSVAPFTLGCTHEEYTPANCTDPERCALCGRAKDGTEALGHTVVTVEKKEPSCSGVGYSEWTYCSVCEEILEEPDEIPSLGHDIVTDAAVAPTCTEAGLTEGSHCTRCGVANVEQTEVPALGHDKVTDAAVAPTCTETGLSEGYHCSRCDEIITEQTEVPALGHDNVTDAAVAPTCTETGLSEGYHCSRCDEIITEQTEVPALGHDYKDATTSAPKTCKVCGHTEGDPLPVESETDAADETEKKEESTKAEATKKPDDKKETNNNGCKSSISFVSISAAVILGAICIFKKKRD